LPMQSQRRYNANEVRFRAYPRPRKELQRKTNSTQTLTFYLRILVPQFYQSQVIIAKRFASSIFLSIFPSSTRQPTYALTDGATISCGGPVEACPASQGKNRGKNCRCVGLALACCGFDFSMSS